MSNLHRSQSASPSNSKASFAFSPAPVKRLISTFDRWDQHTWDQ
jgi:hypothetical protein